MNIPTNFKLSDEDRAELEQVRRHIDARAWVDALRWMLAKERNARLERELAQRQAVIHQVSLMEIEETVARLKGEKSK